MFGVETVCEFHKLRKNEVSPTSLGLRSPPNLRSGPKALSSVTVLMIVFETVCDIDKLRENEVYPTSLGLLSFPNLRSGSILAVSIHSLFRDRGLSSFRLSLQNFIHLRSKTKIEPGAFRLLSCTPTAFCRCLFCPNVFCFGLSHLYATYFQKCVNFLRLFR